MDNQGHKAGPFEDIPMIKLDEDGGADALRAALRKVEGSTAYRNDRERPYNGQPWTHNGTFGKTLVTGLTMRDIADCMTQAFLVSDGNGDLYKKVIETREEMVGTEYAATGNWRSSDLYEVDPTKLSPHAVVQNVMRFILHYMDDEPNVTGEDER